MKKFFFGLLFVACATFVSLTVIAIMFDPSGRVIEELWLLVLEIWWLAALGAAIYLIYRIAKKKR